MAKLTGNEVFIDIVTKAYPLTMDAVRRKKPNVIFGTNATTDMLRTFGFAVVTQVTRPVADVVTEEPPVKTEDGYLQVFSSRSFTEEEKNQRLQISKDDLSRRVDIMLNGALGKGVQFDFGEPHGVLHVQMRDKDRLNVIGMRTLANGGVEPQPFRTYENVNLVLSAQQVLDMAAAVHTGYLSLLGRAWTLKDQIENATSAEELPELPNFL